ncbi:MAG TPA: exodeoxyribonuclease III [Patescibacteria group bacterium]|nr:exodeoxyribonuclease III [Patescibacteria group bacterium]
MRIGTWNVNSLKARLPHVLAWLKKNKPDVLLLQELKGLEFPAASIAALGYHAEFVAQKTYNGVAILSRHPIKVVATTLKGDEADSHARYLEADINGLRIINIYLPNGNPPGSDNFAYKLAWMDRFKKRLQALKKAKTPVVIGGDYNVIPTDIDCHNPKYWKSDALIQPEVQARFADWLKLGYVDAFRHVHGDETGQFTYFEYWRDMFGKNYGIRIDHFLVAAAVAKKIKDCRIDREPRALEKPSDHCPVILDLK